MNPVRDSAVRVGFVYPELLGTYGDRGNAVVLVQRCRWRGIPAELVEISAGQPIPESLDVYLFGGGEDDPMTMAAAGMRASRSAIERARAGGAAVLAVCGGFQLVGDRYVAADGEVLEGIGIVDLVTHAGSPRLIGEVVIDPDPPLPRLTGFENHGGRTTLGPGVRPLGRVVTGGGNGDGSTVDAAGRIYVTTNPGVQVISPEGKYLGLIPTPRGVITTAFSGKDKKTLFILARGAKDASGNEVANAAQVYAIPMIAQGYKGRAK